MRRGTYLNAVLTVNAVLLSGLLWTQIAERPLLDSSAGAQSRTRPAGVPTIPNAAKQRDEMIKAIDELRVAVKAQQRLLESGKVRVEVTNLDDIKIDVPNRR